jgi:hypothetical protein
MATNETLASLQHIIIAADHEPRAYFGRGMYGKECLAVTLDAGVSPFSFISDLMEQLATNVGEGMTGADLDFFLDATSSVTEALRTAKTDSMGHGTVVYFPGTEYVETDTEEESPDSV